MTVIATDRREIPRCDLQQQATMLESELMDAAQRVIRSGRYILGPECEAFAGELAAYVGARQAIGVASGTDALALALLATGIGPGDRVITSPFTFFATAGAILRVGAEPVLVDIDPETYNLNPDTVHATLEGRSPVHQRLGVDPAGIRAIVPVHLFGLPAPTDTFMRLAEKRRLVVIEDAAQAIGSQRSGRHAGTVGHAGCFSFFPTKNLGGLGDGGMVVTDDAGVAEAVIRLRAHGATSPYHHDIVGTNSRLDEIQAAFLRVKLRYLPSWIARRRMLAARYSERLDGIPGLHLPADDGQAVSSYHHYTVGITGGGRDALQRHLDKDGIASAIYYPVPLHLQPALHHLGYRPGDLPGAEQASREVLSLPMYPELEPDDVDRVARSIHRHFGL